MHSTHVAAQPEAIPVTSEERWPKYAVWSALTLALSLLLRVIASSFLDLTFMETYGAVVARQPSLSYFDQPPITWWTIAAAVRLFGSEDATVVRLPFLLMSALSGWLIFAITSRLFTARAGFFAVGAYAFSPLLGISDGSLAQTNGPMTVFVLAALYAFTRIDFADRSASARNTLLWYLVSLLFGCALACKYLAVLLAPGLLVFMLSRADARRWLLRPSAYLGFVFMLVPLAPVIIWNAEHGWVSFLYQGARAGGDGSLNAFRAFRWTLTQVLIVHPLVFVVAIAALYGALRRGPGARSSWLLACLSAPALVFFVGVMLWSSHPLRGYHWASIGYLPLLPLVGDWADRTAAARPWIPRRWLATLAATSAAAILLLLLHVETGWAERVAPAKAFRSQDPILLELYDWSDLPDALKARGIDPARTFVAATRWEDCAKAFYVLRDGFRGLCLAGDNIHFTYMDDPARYRGMDAIIVDRYADIEAIRRNVEGHFDGFAEAAPVRLTFHGRRMLDLTFVRATNFDGTWPKVRAGAKGRQ